MFDFKAKVKNNELDAEIDEFGDLQSIDIENDKVKFNFKRRLSPKALDRKKYNRTGIMQFGTTYPNSYDREELIDVSRKTFLWYRNAPAIFFLTLAIIAIDFTCYITMFTGEVALENLEPATVLISLGIAIAIDLLPLFIAHNFHRQEIDRKKVLKIFNICCIVLIVVFVSTVFVYRVLNPNSVASTSAPTMASLQSDASKQDTSKPDASKQDPSDNQSDKADNVEYAETYVKPFLYLLIPFATSLFCFIVNYLSYDLIRKKILQKEREILFKREDVYELKAAIQEMDSKSDYYDLLLKKDDMLYQAAFDKVDSICAHYKAYVRTKIAEAMHSPADTTDLTK